MMQRATLALMLAGLFCLSAVGCGNSYDLVPVSGKITVDGEPLANASVIFQPTEAEPGSPSSVAVTDAQGQYTLKTATANPQDGAVPGPHRVTLSAVTKAPQSGEAPAEEATLPKKAAEANLTFDVPAGGTSEANFEL